MKKRILFAGMLAIMLTTTDSVHAQQQKPDSVVIKVGEGSKIVVSIADKKDLQILKHYNFQALMNDLIAKIEENDTTDNVKPSSEYLAEETTEELSEVNETTESSWNDDFYSSDNSHRDRHNYRSSYRSRRTYHSISFELGTNNYLQDDKFPDANNDLYTVKPFGSWYVGVNSIQRTRLARKFYIEWGLGVSWYNFKFENSQTSILKDNAGVTFVTDARDLDFVKSKLTATYLNASFVPVLDFGENRRKPMLFDNDNSDSFRIGAGPYAGYRIASHSKIVYEEGGDKEREKSRDNFYLNNIRYGARLQLGYRDVDLFFNYDMNELFSSGKGPALNAFSFGLIL
jgi:hypothetical protein